MEAGSVESETDYSDAKSLLEWNDERAAKFAAAEKKMKRRGS
jgi:hypothetical protein